MRTLPTAAIIGAGSSGIAAAKALHQRGVPFVCFEASGRVGGSWFFENRNGMTGWSTRTIRCPSPLRTTPTTPRSLRTSTMTSITSAFGT
jgi:cation diffusion facilitator CzcD-associated flavoprotein CzcO